MGGWMDDWVRSAFASTFPYRTEKRRKAVARKAQSAHTGWAMIYIFTVQIIRVPTSPRDTLRRICAAAQIQPEKNTR